MEFASSIVRVQASLRDVIADVIREQLAIFSNGERGMGSGS